MKFQFKNTDLLINFLLALLFLSYSHTALSQQTIFLNSALGSPVSNKSQTGFADLVVAEAFRRIGYKLQIVRLPAERALINANRGLEDGNLVRVAGLQKKYTNLIQVPEPVMIIDMVLFSKNKPSFVVNGWESVASYSLAIISGWKIMEKNFSKLGDKVEIIKTDNAKQSFILLEKDRVDFIAYSKWSGLGYLTTHKITDVKLLSPPLARSEQYVYLHKRHKKIVPQLAAALRQMKADGTVKKLFEKILKPLMQKNYNINYE